MNLADALSVFLLGLGAGILSAFVVVRWSNQRAHYVFERTRDGYGYRYRVDFGTTPERVGPYRTAEPIAPTPMPLADEHRIPRGFSGIDDGTSHRAGEYWFQRHEPGTDRAPPIVCAVPPPKKVSL